MVQIKESYSEVVYDKEYDITFYKLYGNYEVTITVWHGKVESLWFWENYPNGGGKGYVEHPDPTFSEKALNDVVVYMCKHDQELFQKVLNAIEDKNSLFYRYGTLLLKETKKQE